MKAFVDIFDSFIRAIQLIARSIAFLLGIHLVIILYFVRILSSEPVESNRRQRRVTLPVRRSHLLTSIDRPYSPARHLHLPALEPRFHDEPLERSSAGIYKHLLSHLICFGFKMRDGMSDLGDRIEAKGGKGGDMVIRFRKRGEMQLNAELLQKLPIEIINHILIIASDIIPTKICLLSKRHHRLVTPRLYQTVQLCDPRIFHLYRMTMAVHNPNIGQYVESLSVASSTFDSYGYFPEAIAESAALGVGLEQILITATNLKHLYLDLFSLAALHDGTASRLQNGSLPISLSTEYAAPQYLSLPLFNKLQHVELSIFGLDKMAVDYLIQALPPIKSLTLRWVTRQSPGFGESFEDMEESSETEGDDVDPMWTIQSTNYQRKDFDSFVEALESLRSNDIQMKQGDELKPPLEAITVLAWPTVMRQLVHYYRHNRDVSVLDSIQFASSVNDPTWNRSLGHQDGPRFDRLTTRPSTTSQALREIKMAPLRLAIDPTYNLGPRRGPLESWTNQWR